MDVDTNEILIGMGVSGEVLNVTPTVEMVNLLHTEIPENSPTVSVDESVARFSSAIWYDRIREQTVLLAGIGGIGSYLAYLLSRMKVKSLFLYDPDTVETVNMAGQLYSKEDIGKPKVEAIADTISLYSEYESVFALCEEFSEDIETADVMICGFDNMKARKVFYKKWIDHVKNKAPEDRHKCLFIDGRLSAEEFQVLCMTGNDDYSCNRYFDDFMFSDYEAETEICSYKQTAFMANMIASVMANLFVNFTANLCKPDIDRALPFFTYYNAETMFFKTES